MSHSKDTFIASCRISYSMEVTSMYLPCGEQVQIQKIFHPEMYNCFVLDVPTFNLETDTMYPTGLSLILFLDYLPGPKHPFHLHGSVHTAGAYMEVDRKADYHLLRMVTSNYFHLVSWRNKKDIRLTVKSPSYLVTPPNSL